MEELTEIPQLDDSSGYDGEEESMSPLDDGVLEEVCGSCTS